MWFPSICLRYSISCRQSPHEMCPCLDRCSFFLCSTEVLTNASASIDLFFRLDWMWDQFNQIFASTLASIQRCSRLSCGWIHDVYSPWSKETTLEEGQSQAREIIRKRKENSRFDQNRREKISLSLPLLFFICLSEARRRFGHSLAAWGKQTGGKRSPNRFDSYWRKVDGWMNTLIEHRFSR